MSFIKELFCKKQTKSKEPVFVVGICNTTLSEMYQDMLKENNIPFICRQDGAEGYIKHITGGFLVTDNIYVREADYDKALELYENYINGKAELELPDSEEQ